MVHNIKELFSDYVLLVKIGTFYNCYNKDANIMSYLFQYKIKTAVSHDSSCGFPTTSLNRIIGVLESRNINYLIVDKKLGYDETDKMNFKKKNKYNEILIKANEYVDKMDRIHKISIYHNNNPDKISKVEDVLYER